MKWMKPAANIWEHIFLGELGGGGRVKTMLI